jgi:hypothetical protein
MDWPLLRKADPEANTRKGGLARQLMSALGQKQTFRTAIAMSALPPKADMCGAPVHVRYGPKADILMVQEKRQ